MAALAAMLRRDGRGALRAEDVETAVALIPEARVVVTHCPPALGITMDDVLALASPTALIAACGPGAPQGDGRVHDLWRDEALLRENARLTAEGAVSVAMRAGRRAVCGLNCLVIGWGRIGSALAEILVALGARVTVASRSAAHCNRALERGAEAVRLEKLPAVLPETALVFSTAPAMVLDASLLARVNREAMIIDLASPPYGVELAAAWRMGLRAWREPGLPGRYCPESAARALYDALKRGNVL